MNTDRQAQAAGTVAAGASAGADSAESVAPLARYFLWTDSPASVDRAIRWLTYFCVILFLIDLVWHRHTKVPGEALWGFHAIAGFVFFTLIVIASRLLRLFLRRNEDYYAPNSVDAESYPQAGTQPLIHAQRTQDSLVGLRNEMLGRDATGSRQGGESS